MSQRTSPTRSTSPASGTASGATTMRAAVIDRFGPPEVVQLVDVPRPTPGPGEVLVRVRTTAVTVADHRMRSRDLPRGMGLAAGAFLGWRRPKHPVLGTDAAGVVEAVGEGVTTYSPGDDVLVMRGFTMGCHAEYLTVPADGGIAPAPGGLTSEEAVSLVFGANTAISFLDRVSLGAGTRVLVNGASGAVGTMAVQLAHAAGAHVTGVTSGRNAELVRSLGADRVIDYATTDFAREDETYDVIVETVGNAPYPRVAPVLRKGGALLLVVSDLPGMLLSWWHGLRGRRLVTFRGAKVPAGRMVERIVELAEAGTLRPVVDRVYDVEEIVEAHRYVDTGRKRGAVVMRMTRD